MIYKNLVACSIDAKATQFRSNRVNLSSDAFAYENDKVMVVFDETSVYILDFESNRVETYRLKLKLIQRSLAHKFRDSFSLYFKYTKNENIIAVLEFETENSTKDMERIEQFLKDTAVLLEKRNKQQMTSFSTSLIGSGILVGLYFIYLTIAPKTFPQLENYHFRQTAPIMIAFVSSFVLIKSYIEKMLSFHTVFFYSLYAFFVSFGQMAHFHYLASQKRTIPNVWSYYYLFLVVLFAPVFVSFIILLKRKTIQQYRKRVPSRLFETSLMLTLATVVLTICMTAASQSSLNIGIADYHFFSNGTFILGMILSIFLVFLLKQENKYTRTLFPLLLTILAFSLAFASSLNSANAYRTVYKEKEESTWRIENKDGILIVQDEYTIIIDGYKFKELPEQNDIKILEIKRVDGTRYNLTISYDGIITDEVWEKNDKDKKLNYVSPVVKEIPEGVPNKLGNGKIIIKKAGTFEDVFSKHFSKKLGENTLTIETSFFVYRQEKGVPYITLRDKENNVIIGGLYYDSLQSKKENKIIGRTQRNFETNTYFEYTFNDDGTYSQKKIGFTSVIETDLPKPEKSSGVLTAEQARLYKSHASYEKQGRFHMVEVYDYNERKEKKARKLYFNDNNEYITLVETCLATDQYLYVYTTNGIRGDYMQHDEHFNETNSKFNLQKTDEEVYWEGKWYFTTYNPTKEGFKLYDENGDVVV